MSEPNSEAMAELQTKQEAVPAPAPAPAPVPTPAPAVVEPPLAEAPPVTVVEKKAAAPPPVADDTKALVVVDNESEFVNSFFNFSFVSIFNFLALEIMGCHQNSIFTIVSILFHKVVVLEENFEGVKINESVVLLFVFDH